MKNLVIYPSSAAYLIFRVVRLPVAAPRTLFRFLLLVQIFAIAIYCELNHSLSHTPETTQFMLCVEEHGFVVR